MLTSRRSLGSRLVLLAASMLLGACGGRSVSGTLPDARVDSTYRPDGGTPPDGGKRPDGGNQADAGCVEGDSWQLVEVPLDSVTVLTNEAYPDRIPEGVAIRIEAVIEVGGWTNSGQGLWPW